jgi:hypothetical protein
MNQTTAKYHMSPADGLRLMALIADMGAPWRITTRGNRVAATHRDDPRTWLALHAATDTVAVLEACGGEAIRLASAACKAKVEVRNG